MATTDVDKPSMFITERRDIAMSVELREGTVLDFSLKSDPWVKVVWARFTKNRAAKVSFNVFVFFTLIAVFWPILVALNPEGVQSFYHGNYGGGSNAYPNLRYPFGTDVIGRDLLSMMIAGSQTAMLVGIGSTVILMVIGVPLGLFAGYYGGKTEEIIMRFTDFFLALPTLIISILAIRVITQNFSQLLTLIHGFVPLVILLVIGLLYWGGTTRLVSATTKQTIELEYVAAAKCLGASNRRIIFKHILPNILAPLIVIGTLSVGSGITFEAAITYLGLGRPTDVSWGNMINNSRQYILLHPQLALIPGLTIFAIVLAINLMGDTLRDALDPRLRE